MKRAVVTAFITISVLSAASGQTAGPRPGAGRCALRLADAPAVRGLRLGMSADQLLALFPGSRENPDIKSKLEWARRAPHYGLANLGFTRGDYPTAALFTNVTQFNIQLFDERVTDIGIYYGGPPWGSVDEMVARVSEALALPGVEEWDASGPSTKALRCEGFEVTVTAYGDGTCCSSLRLRVPAVDQRVRERRVAEEEKARREFKP